MLGWKKAGGFLLLMPPVVDSLLIIVTVVDLRNGTPANFMHGLAAVYLGVTVAFGHRMIRWADERFAHRFAGGPKPVPKARYGKAHARMERAGWYRHVLAWIIGSLLLGMMVLLVGDFERTRELWLTGVRWAAILGVDFVISFSYTLWPKKEKSVCQ